MLEIVKTLPHDRNLHCGRRAISTLDVTPVWEDEFKPPTTVSQAAVNCMIQMASVAIRPAVIAQKEKTTLKATRSGWEQT